MAAKGVVDRVAAVLGTTWTATDGNILPVFVVNYQSAAPSDGGPFIEATFPVANPGGGSFGSPGSNLWREDGAFIIVINEKKSIASDRVMQWAEEIGALFRGKSFGLLETLDATINDWGPKANYYQLAVVVQYRFDKIG